MGMDLYISTDPPTAEDIRLTRYLCAIIEYAELHNSEIAQLEYLLGLDLKPLYTSTHPEVEDKTDAWQSLDDLIACLTALLAALKAKPDALKTIDAHRYLSNGREYFSQGSFATEIETFLAYLERAKLLGATKVLIEAD